MKNKFCVFLLIFQIFALPVFAIEKPCVFQLALGSGANSYGATEITELKQNYFATDKVHIFANFETSFNFYLDEYFQFCLGAITSFDLFQKSANSLFMLDYDAFFGARIFPGLPAFCFGVDYICGSFYKISRLDGEKNNNFNPWSNGFRFICEYNFMKNKPKWSPAVGIYWQNMPRLGGYDNRLAIYVKASLRGLKKGT